MRRRSSCSVRASGRIATPRRRVRSGPRTWAKLSDLLVRQSFPGRGTSSVSTADEIDRSLGVGGDEAARYARLLSRGGQLAFELDRLRSRGIWVVTIADEAYPTRLVERFGSDAPPVLFGSGDPSRLDGGGIAIVGSRDADGEAVAFTERLAAAAARGGTPVVSGGARGIDVTAMRAAAAADGVVVGVLSEGVERRLRESDTRSRRRVGAGGARLAVSPGRRVQRRGRDGPEQDHLRAVGRGGRRQQRDGLRRDVDRGDRGHRGSVGCRS